MSELAGESFGEGDPHLVFLHGFTQTRASWQTIGRRLAARHRITLIDLPGHGATSARPQSLDEAGRLVAQACGRSVLVGYSMGARVALHAALHPSSELTGLVLIGAHPGIVDESERMGRIETDDSLARRIEVIGVREFLAEWLAQPMFTAVRNLDHQDRLTNTPEGLAYALRTMGTGRQRVLDAELERLDVPTLLVVGEHDDKFLALAKRMRSILPHATIATIPDAGHACHLEQPVATRETIEAWIRDLRNGDAQGE